MRSRCRIAAARGGRAPLGGDGIRRGNPDGLVGFVPSRIPSVLPGGQVKAWRTELGDEVYMSEEEGAFFVAVYLPSQGEFLPLNFCPHTLAAYKTSTQGLGAGLRVIGEARAGTWTAPFTPDAVNAIAEFVERPRNRVEYVRMFDFVDGETSNHWVLTASPELVMAHWREVLPEVRVRPQMESYGQIKARLMRE